MQPTHDPVHPHSHSKINPTRPDIHENGIEEHLTHIRAEFQDGFEFLKKYPKSVSIFGSSRTPADQHNYKKAEELGKRIVEDLNYAVITGGGPGIMEAANKGAYEARGTSLGLNISLPKEWTTNAYVTHSIKFSYFFARKTMLAFAAEAYVFFPGGFGTFDELSGILTLIQTQKIPHVPIILYDSKFWNGYAKFVKDYLCDSYKTISPKDMNLFEITDSIDRVIEVIKKAPYSEWWRNIN
jgi:uncharacterized protein (TIGR00730 family)